MDRRQLLTACGAAAAGLATARVARAHGTSSPPHSAAVNQLHAYLCAFHTAKKDPKFVVEAHHYCAGVRDGVHQCIIFDSKDKNARILGVEYIITDEIYRTLPDSEKRYYHPHAYEVLSGLLMAPGMPAGDEKKFMEYVLTTWGKTWHTWPDPSKDLPLGEPLLMWSANKDGSIPEDLIERRDKQFGVSTAEVRKSRSYLGPVPQLEPPKSMDELGRRFTAEGPDEPPKK